MAQWVQSKYNKEAKKWEVSYETEYDYCVQGLLIYFLPKEDYVPCDPPERWEGCTREVVEVCENGRALNLPDPTLNAGKFNYMGNVSSGYRWVWSEKDPDALVIERRV